MNNFYMKPSYKRPYYYIYNKNTGKALPTDTIEYDDSIETGIPTFGSDIIADEHTHSAPTEYSRVIKLNNGQSVSVLKSEKPSGIRGGNPTNIILEIRCGKDNTVFQLAGVNIDYLKTPQHIRLTQEQLDYTEDKSQIVEFPDYVCQEIINELVHIVMENASDPRLQTHIPVS